MKPQHTQIKYFNISIPLEMGHAQLKHVMISTTFSCLIKREQRKNMAKIIAMK